MLDRWTWGMVCATASTIGLMAFCVWYVPRHPQHIFAVLVAVIGLIATTSVCVRFYQTRKRLAHFDRDLGAEMTFGQRLDTLSAKGYRVYHHVRSDRGNIDHVIIGPPGVFVIATKTISKPPRGISEITYDGEYILINDDDLKPDPLPQARASCDAIDRMLEHGTARRPPLRLVMILFCSSWVVTQTGGSGTWVMAPDAFFRLLAHQPELLSAADITLFSTALETCNHSHP
jgi:hypothetical protein